MRYEVWFQLIDEEKVNFINEKYYSPIIKAIENFNIVGQEARNKKHIYEYDIEKDIIKNNH